MKPLISRKCKYCKVVKTSDDFYKDKTNPLGFGYGCKECLKQFQKKYIIKNRKKLTEYYRNKRRKIKTTLIKENGGKCSICGYDKYIGALAFHHKNPSQKDFCVGRQTGINKARKEAKKCILVCANCHAEVHGGITSTPL